MFRVTFPSTRNLFVWICLLSLPTLCLAENREVYKLGVIIPLSGQTASLGNYVKRGVELALLRLPEERRKLIEVNYEDDKFDPSQTITAYRKLSAQPGIDAAFVMASPPANALVPITEREEKILIAIGASDPSIALKREYAFIHWVIPPVLGDTLAKELQRRNFKRICVMAGEVTGSMADAEALIAGLNKLGLGDKVVYKEYFPKDQTDYRSEIAALRHKNCDALVTVLFPGAISSFAKQFRSAKLNAELIGIETFEDEAEVKAAEGSLLGAWYVNASDGTQDFNADYKQTFGELPGWASANAYDSLMLLVSALAAVGNDNKKIGQYLRTIKNYKGAAGLYSASGDNRFMLPAALKRITATGFEPMGLG